MAATAAPAPAPQYSVGDVVNSFAKTPGANAPVCPPDQVPDEDGICQPKKDTRGFSLPTRGAPAKPKAASGAGTAVAGAATPAPAAHRDLLISFKLGSAELTDQAKANARVFAQAIATPQLADARFEIEGHTDTTGSEGRNQTLSEARAAAVQAFLVSVGADASRLQVKGYGSTRLALQSDPTSAANRRVEARRLN